MDAIESFTRFVATDPSFNTSFTTKVAACWDASMNFYSWGCAMLDLSVLPTPRLIDYGTSSVFGRHSTMEYHFSTISERI